jgi:hypothetical protein
MRWWTFGFLRHGVSKLDCEAEVGYCPNEVFCRESMIRDEPVTHVRHRGDITQAAKVQVTALLTRCMKYGTSDVPPDWSTSVLQKQEPTHSTPTFGAINTESLNK